VQTDATAPLVAVPGATTRATLAQSLEMLSRVAQSMEKPWLKLVPTCMYSLAAQEGVW
jgi:hypothetical protein